MHEIVQTLSNVPHVAAAASWQDALPHVLHRDYETRSQAIIKTVGTYKYATDSSTTVLCTAFAIDDEPVQLWTPGNPVPAEFIEAATNPAWVVCAHGAHFEDAIEHHVLHSRFGWPVFPVEKQRCTQAMALALGLPARLSLAAIALELSNRKDAAGERLMHQTSKPRRPRKDENPDGIYWFEDQERLDRLYAYCKQDIEIERELYTRLPPLSRAEQAIWELSTKINARGCHVDRAFAEAARKIAEAAAPEIEQEIAEISSGDVTSINQVARLTTWLQAHGCTLQKLDRAAVERQLGKDDLPPTVRRALESRPLPTGDMSAKPTPQPKPPETVEAPEVDHRGFAHFVVRGRQATRRQKCKYFVADRVPHRQAPSQPIPSSPSMRPKFVGSASARSPTDTSVLAGAELRPR